LEQTRALNLPAREAAQRRGVGGTPCAREPEMLLEVVQNIKQVIDFNNIGEVAERLNAPVLKTGKVSQPS
jgi:hypothetical protein